MGDWPSGNVALAAQVSGRKDNESGALLVFTMISRKPKLVNLVVAADMGLCATRGRLIWRGKKWAEPAIYEAERAHQRHSSACVCSVRWHCGRCPLEEEKMRFWNIAGGQAIGRTMIVSLPFCVGCAEPKVAPRWASTRMTRGLRRFHRSPPLRARLSRTIRLCRFTQSRRLAMSLFCNFQFFSKNVKTT